MTNHYIIRSFCLISALLLINLNHGFGQISLDANEEIIFSFKTVNGKSIQIIKEKNDKYIFYRASKNGKIELEYPEKNTDSWKKFHYTYYFRPNSNDLGMDLKFLEFTNEGYQYVVYDIYYESGNEQKMGVRCTDQKTQKIFDLRAVRKSAKGDLSQLIYNELISSSVGQLFE